MKMSLQFYKQKNRGFFEILGVMMEFVKMIINVKITKFHHSISGWKWMSGKDMQQVN